MLFWLAKSPWKFYFCALFSAILFSICLGKSELVLLACQRGYIKKKTLNVTLLPKPILFDLFRNLSTRELGLSCIFLHGSKKNNLSKSFGNLEPQIEIKTIGMRVQKELERKQQVSKSNGSVRDEMRVHELCAQTHVHFKNKQQSNIFVNVNVWFLLCSWFRLFLICVNMRYRMQEWICDVCMDGCRFEKGNLSTALQFAIVHEQKCNLYTYKGNAFIFKWIIMKFDKFLMCSVEWLKFA